MGLQVGFIENSNQLRKLLYRKMVFW